MGITIQIMNYVMRIQQQRRAQGFTGFYQDETWSTSRTHQELECVDVIDQFGLPIPSGKGERIVATHVIGPICFLDGALLMFLGRNAAWSDYHGEMASIKFFKWLEERHPKHAQPQHPGGRSCVMPCHTD